MAKLEILPYDIKQTILDEVDSEKDLLQFALSSKDWCSMIIPRQLEYRSLRLDVDRPEVWRHLAEKPGLAARIRTVVLGPNFPHIDPVLAALDPWPFKPDIYPRALLEDGNNTDGQQRDIFQDVRKAFANMTLLETFQWIIRPCPWVSGMRMEISPVYETGRARGIFQGIQEASSVRRLCIADHDWRLFYPENEGLKKADDPFYQLRGLEELLLSTWQFTDPSPETSNVLRLFRNNMNTLRVIDLDLPWIPLEAFNFTFPHLETVFLFSAILEGKDDLQEREQRAVSFFSLNPTIRHLKWSPKYPLQMPARSPLPNLETLVSNGRLIHPLLQTERPSRALTAMIAPLDSLPVLSGQGDALRSLKFIQFYCSMNLELSDLVALGTILPCLEIVGFKRFGWLNESDLLEFVGHIANLKVLFGCHLEVLDPNFDRDTFARKVRETAPSLVYARIFDKGQVHRVHLQSRRWEVEDENEEIALPHGSSCSEEEFDSIQDYCPPDISDFQPEPTGDWETDD